MLILLLTQWQPRTATASLTEAADTLASTVAVTDTVTLSVTEANDNVAATALATDTATLSVTEAGDTVSSTATATDTATLAFLKRDPMLLQIGEVDLLEALNQPR